MYREKKISLVLPTRNEASHIEKIIDMIPDYVDEILVVSNKSTDNTVEVVKSIATGDSRVRALKDDRTIDGIGYGFAHITGINAATGDIIAGADSDGTYPYDKINEFVDEILDDGRDFIVGTRYPVPADVNIPFMLRLGVNILNLEIAVLYGKRIHDALSGMWVFKSEIISDLNLKSGDWNLSPEIKINAMQNKNINFSEKLIHQEVREGETKQSYFKTGFNHAMWILKYRFKK